MSKAENIKVVVVEPNEEAKIIEVKNTLESMQELVGGYIETYGPFEDEAIIVCNEEGRMNGMPSNRAMRDKDGNILNIICGPFFVCYAPFDSEDFLSLSDEMAEKYKELFKVPELFISTEHGTIVVPISLETE